MTVFFHYSLYGFSNVYLVANDATKEAVIVDPAEFNVNLLNFIEKRNYYITTVLITHNHAHHCKGLNTLLRIYDAKVFSSNALIDGNPCSVVHDGDEFDACGFSVNVVSVPGHSADSVVYKMAKLLFTGDTIQAGLIGKTMSQYGHGLLKDQLAMKVLNQTDDTIILPGHGPPTTVGAEKLYNIGFKKTKAEARSEKYELFL
jgi:glyoxylase-like metal-dependent hydrolase (beta-lactamase superfamily II)